MKRQIRQGCFETNSSSVHTICVASQELNRIKNLPSSVSFEFGSYGWELDKYTSRFDRANYLYTAIIQLGGVLKKLQYSQMIKRLQFINDTLKKHNIDVYFADFGVTVSNWEKKIVCYTDCLDESGIDHVGELEEFVNTVCSDEDILMNYLFSEQSYIQTGNDNEDIVPVINVDYPHREFYKYN